MAAIRNRRAEAAARDGTCRRPAPVKRANAVLTGRGLLRIGCRPAKSRICEVPMPRRQREMGRWGELTSKPPEQGGRSIGRVSVRDQCLLSHQQHRLADSFACMPDKPAS